MKPSKTQLIIAYHGMFTPREICERIPCSRELVYMVWKECELPYDIEPMSQQITK